MIKSIHKLSNKHYIQCGLALLLTGNLLWLTSSLWYGKNTPMLWKVRFDWYNFTIIAILVFLLMYKFVQYLSKFKIEKHHSRIDIVMVAVFFGLLFLPMSHISDAEKSEQENRMLAKKPQLTIDNGGETTLESNLMHGLMIDFG